IVRDYPLSSRAEDAKRRLADLEMPVPQVDRAAYDREKFEIENYHKPGLLARSTAIIHGGPDVSHAAKSGQPTMTDPKPTIPASVPIVNTAETPAAGGGAGTTELSATQLGSGSSALDKKPDARSSGGTAQNASAQTNQPLPTNRDKELKQLREKQAKKQAALEKKKKKKNPEAAGQPQQTQSQATQTAQTPAGTPNSVPAVSNPATTPSTTNVPPQQ
ncbi:MAG: hypothetical protein WB992_26100, partial [Bryobacteraceae bacterium]